MRLLLGLSTAYSDTKLAKSSRFDDQISTVIWILHYQKQRSSCRSQAL